MHVSLLRNPDPDKLPRLQSVTGEDDDDLYESLARARRAADKQQKQGVANLQDTLAEDLASRRDQDEAHQAMDIDRPAGSPDPRPHPCSQSCPAQPAVCINLRLQDSHRLLLFGEYSPCLLFEKVQYAGVSILSLGFAAGAAVLRL